MLISLYGHTRQNHAITPLQNFITALLANGFQVEIEKRFASYLRHNEAMPKQCLAVNAPAPKSSLLISIGGDGTLLRAARWLKQLPLPIAGINTGHLGYLAPWTFEDAPHLLISLADRQLQTEPRSLLRLDIKAANGETLMSQWPYALNDIAILKDNSASMISVHTRLNGTYLTDYLADGLIISTPTGSTAYNLSAGGPILQPTAPALALTPVAPHTLTMRPLVIQDDALIEATPSTRSGRYILSLDGDTLSLPSETPLTIQRAPFTINIVRKPADDFATTLRTKLLWGTHTIKP